MLRNLFIAPHFCEGINCLVDYLNYKPPSNKYHRLLLNKNRANGDLRLTQEQCVALATAESNLIIKMDKLHNKRPS